MNTITASALKDIWPKQITTSALFQALSTLGNEQLVFKYAKHGLFLQNRLVSDNSRSARLGKLSDITPEAFARAVNEVSFDSVDQVRQAHKKYTAFLIAERESIVECIEQARPVDAYMYNLHLEQVAKLDAFLAQ